jgi:hypothetical protein
LWWSSGESNPLQNLGKQALRAAADPRVVLELNRRAQAAIPAQCQVAAIPGATHLFDGPGTLDQVTMLARDWFRTHLSHLGAAKSAVRPQESSSLKQTQ